MPEFAVVIADEEIAWIDTDQLSVADFVEFEQQETVTGMVRWLVKFGNAEHDHVLEVFKRIPLGELRSIPVAVGRAIAGGISVPKSNGTPSADPSQRTERGRPRGPRALTTQSDGDATPKRSGAGRRSGSSDS